MSHAVGVPSVVLAAVAAGLLLMLGGVVIRRFELTKVLGFATSDVENGNLLAMSDDGRIIRLVPRN